MRFLLLLYRGCKKHLKIKGTRNYYFKTIGYCSRTKVKSSLILRGFYLTWPWALTLGLKCYYLWELYHAWVLVITLTLQTLPVQPWGLSELTKSGQRLKPFNYTSSYAKVLTFVYAGILWFTVSNAFERSKNISWCILYRQFVSRLSLIMLCLSKNLILLLYINFFTIFENHGWTETGFLQLEKPLML